jgi:hypothetical protein
MCRTLRRPAEAPPGCRDSFGSFVRTRTGNNTTGLGSTPRRTQQTLDEIAGVVLDGTLRFADFA